MQKNYVDMKELQKNKDAYRDWFDCIYNGIVPNISTIDKNEIKSIQVNEPKRIVTVVFADKDARVIKCSKEDAFDVNIGVALAIAEHLLKSRTQFHKLVKSKAKYVECKKS